jgi:hypothetical protein
MLGLALGPVLVSVPVLVLVPVLGLQLAPVLVLVPDCYLMILPLFFTSKNSYSYVYYSIKKTPNMSVFFELV